MKDITTIMLDWSKRWQGVMVLLYFVLYLPATEFVVRPSQQEKVVAVIVAHIQEKALEEREARLTDRIAQLENEKRILSGIRQSVNAKRMADDNAVVERLSTIDYAIREKEDERRSVKQILDRLRENILQQATTTTRGHGK